MSDWIPVKQKLPEIGQRFDAWVHGKYEPNCGAYVGSWSDEDRKATMLVKGITHWKPVPSAPTWDYKKCPNTDSNGSCPLHNLHCGYPDCERELIRQPPSIEE